MMTFPSPRTFDDASLTSQDDTHAANTESRTNREVSTNTKEKRGEKKKVVEEDSVCESGWVGGCRCMGVCGEGRRCSPNRSGKEMQPKQQPTLCLSKRFRRAAWRYAPLEGRACGEISDSLARQILIFFPQKSYLHCNYT